MRKIGKLFLVFLLLGLIYGNVFAQTEEVQIEEAQAEEYEPEFFHALVGLSDEQGKQLRESMAAIDQKLSKVMRDAGYTSVDPENWEEQAVLFSGVMKNLTPEIEMTVRSVVPEEQYRTAQERLLIYNQYADLEAMTLEETKSAFQCMLEGEFAFQPLQQLDLSPEQKTLLESMQAEQVKDLIGFTVEIEAMFEKEILPLMEEFEKAESEGNVEKLQVTGQAIQKRVEDIEKETAPKLKKLLKKFREQQMRLLNDSQKAELKRLYENMPDSLHKMMPGYKGEKPAWRPGANSWMPGMGAPEGAEDMREAKPERPRGERTFPE